MKAYVIEYGSMQDDPQRFEVRYGSDPNPGSQYKLRQVAETASRELNRFEVRAGAHTCAYSVDCLPDGHFALFCVCHPHFVSAQSNVPASKHTQA